MRRQILLAGYSLLLSLMLVCSPLVAEETPATDEESSVVADDTHDTSSWKDKVVVVPVKGPILPKMKGNKQIPEFEKAFKRINRELPRLVVVEVNSPGGEVNACNEMARTIRECKVPTVALVIKEAISGGAMVSTACKEIEMERGSLIGDVQPMDGMGKPMPEREAEKIETYIRAIMELNATENGYPKKLLKAMVSRSIELYEIRFNDQSREFLSKREVETLEEDIAAGRDKRTIAGKSIVSEGGQLLTLSPERALELGLAKRIVENREDFFTQRDIPKEDIIEAVVAEGGLNLDELLEGLGTGMMMLLGIFLIIGVAGTLAEMHMPGFGVPGAFGIIGFAGFFTILLLNGRASEWEIGLFLVGMILLVVEIVLIPGFGVPGALGICCVLAGLFLSFMPSFDTPLWEFGKWDMVSNFILLLSGVTLALLALGALLATYGDKLPFLHALYHQKALRGGDEVLADVRKHEQEKAGTGGTQENPYEKYMGKTGVALTLLRPAGKVRLDDGEQIDVVTSGVMISADAAVKVVDTSMNRIVVAAVEVGKPEEKGEPGPSTAWDTTRRQNLEG